MIKIQGIIGDSRPAIVDPMMRLITAAGRCSAAVIALNDDVVFEAQPAR